MKFFAYIIVIIVVLAVVTGFLMIGSPKEERLRKFDERKIHDMTMIESEIIGFWQKKDKLPVNLDELNKVVPHFTMPRDPQSGQAYEYTTLTLEKFQICANFNLPSANETTIRYESRVIPNSPSKGIEFGGHEAGRACFERFIDKDFVLKQNQP